MGRSPGRGGAPGVELGTVSASQTPYGLGRMIRLCKVTRVFEMPSPGNMTHDMHKTHRWGTKGNDLDMVGKCSWELGWGKVE